MIPRGLPGEGNILVFDNGGTAGYGAPNPGAPTGLGNAKRDSSRVLEFDPTTLEIIWRYPTAPAGNQLYSSFVCSAQRLPNGNTLITEGQNGRLIEVTREHEIVWEYLSPVKHRRLSMNLIYRAYRVPFEWAPQAERSKETAIPRTDNNRFRVPRSPRPKTLKVTTLKK
jgi:hypothetical protein